jgi:hypothetical protein
MKLYLVLNGGTGGFEYMIYDTEISPCPSIMADGIGGYDPINTGWNGPITRQK